MSNEPSFSRTIRELIKHSPLLVRIHYFAILISSLALFFASYIALEGWTPISVVLLFVFFLFLLSPLFILWFFKGE